MSGCSMLWFRLPTSKPSLKFLGHSCDCKQGSNRSRRFCDGDMAEIIKWWHVGLRLRSNEIKSSYPFRFENQAVVHAAISRRLALGDGFGIKTIEL
jgi:hypothetical protein